MSKDNNHATSTPEVPEVKVPFNPFTALSVEQLTELLAKFPKAWRESNTVAISNAQTEHSIDESEAIMLVWLQNEADSRIVAKKVTGVSVRIINLIDAVKGTQSGAALEMIKAAYEELPVANRKDCGIKVRDAVVKKMMGPVADEKLKLVTEFLGTTIKNWMR